MEDNKVTDMITEREGYSVGESSQEKVVRAEADKTTPPARSLRVAQGKPAPQLLVEFFCPDKNCPVVQTLDAYAGPPTCAGVANVRTHPRCFMEPRASEMSQQFHEMGHVVDVDADRNGVLITIRGRNDLLNVEISSAVYRKG